MKIEKILIGIDFGPKTDSIISYASYFADKLRASLHLLYVIDYIVTPPAYLIPYIEEEKKNAEKNFEAVKKLFSSANIINIETEVIIGRLQESFHATLKRINADMLILGFMTHTFRRSSSEKLIKGLQIPMLVVRGKKSNFISIKSLKINKMLCPVDFSEQSKKALNVALQLKDMFSAKLEILHVSQDYLIKRIKRLQEQEKEKDRALNELKEKTRETLNSFIENLSLKEQGFIYEGEPVEKIISFVEERDIDLVIMGAKGLGLIKGMLIGSVTDAVLKASPCPVLVIN